MTTTNQALIAAQRAINSMKNEAETAAQGDEQMMLEACEEISKQGLAADTAIRAALDTTDPAGGGEPRMQRTISRLQKQITDLKASRDHFRLLATPPAAPNVTEGASGRAEPAAENAALRRRVSDQERRLSAQGYAIREWRRLEIAAASTEDPEAFNCLRAELSSWAKTYDGSTTNLPAAPAAAAPESLMDERLLRALEKIAHSCDIDTLGAAIDCARQALAATSSAALPASPAARDYCEEKLKPGGCQLHNLHCGYPACNIAPTKAEEVKP